MAGDPRRETGQSGLSITERPVSLGEGAGALHGTLALPDGGGACDAVLIWSGAGPTDRDGNSIGGWRNNSLKMLARALAEAGYAALRTDKRGIGGSEAALAREEDARLGMFVDDAVAWAWFLRDLSRIRNVFLLGHSEGALIATLAARDFDAAGLILIAGAGFPAAETLRRQIADPAIRLPQDQRDETRRILSALERGEPVADVPDALFAAYRPSVQPYLISWFAVDPAEALSQAAMPVLVVQGANDFQVSVEDAERLAASRDGIRLVVVDGMNHILKEAPVDRQDNYRTYFLPMLDLHPGLLGPVLDFLRAAGAANDR